MAESSRTDFHKVFPVEIENNALVVIPQGDAAGFRDSDIYDEMNALLELLDRSRFGLLLIDLGKSNYFGTVIIGVMNSLAQKIRKRGGKTAICNVSTDMLNILRVMKLDEMWPSYGSRDEAISALAD